VLEARRTRVAGGFRDDKNVQWRLALIGVFLHKLDGFQAVAYVEGGASTMSEKDGQRRV
jgi:hypothetical protein